jgi:hypothetical protein
MTDVHDALACPGRFGHASGTRTCQNDINATATVARIVGDERERRY